MLHRSLTEKKCFLFCKDTTYIILWIENQTTVKKCVVFLPPGSSWARCLCVMEKQMGKGLWKRQSKRKDIRKSVHARTLDHSIRYKSFHKIQKWLELKKSASGERKVECIWSGDDVHAEQNIRDKKKLSNREIKETVKHQHAFLTSSKIFFSK